MGAGIFLVIMVGSLVNFVVNPPGKRKHKIIMPTKDLVVAEYITCKNQCSEIDQDCILKCEAIK